MLRYRLLLLFAFLLGIGFDAASFAQTGKKVGKQRYCPVYTDRIVGPNSRFLRYAGIKVYFSSDLAARKWMRDPESYLDKALLPQLVDLTFPARLTRQHYCPVRTKWKISMRDPSLIYDGRRVFLFDEEAVQIWNSAPEKFLDPELLPQFAEEEKPADEDEEDEETPPSSP